MGYKGSAAKVICNDDNKKMKGNHKIGMFVT